MLNSFLLFCNYLCSYNDRWKNSGAMNWNRIHQGWHAFSRLKTEKTFSQTFGHSAHSHRYIFLQFPGSYNCGQAKWTGKSTVTWQSWRKVSRDRETLRNCCLIKTVDDDDVLNKQRLIKSSHFVSAQEHVLRLSLTTWSLAHCEPRLQHIRSAPNLI